ncbi:hypothetical protein HHK36_031684 [Tetracentron sinense]|uniref:Fe2OG dioxygenase domain-containing protein n=1 Tax=Tetracentron sinense TaxID=13715 RepID=A0A834Y982_TETSI|nr:hypothetical protein HHK36_031684 [Tetracentron sinense]
MAGSPTKQDLIWRSVQELAINGDKPPARYIFCDGDGEQIDGSPPLFPVPVIDVSLITSSTSQSSKEDEELEKLQSALSSCGCFQAVGHGISSSFLDKVREVAKLFFELPTEEKQKYSRAVDELQGYGTDQVLSEHQILDWSDRMFLGVHPEDQRKLKLWPENPRAFREVLHEFTANIKFISEILLKAMARSLKLEENCFLNQFGEQSTMIARFNYYPHCARPDLVLGVKPHADGSGITILLQDREVEGLQLLENDRWVRVPIIPDALFVNVGDQVQIMSNGIFKSPVHRVVTNSERERITLAVFYMPQKEKEIGPEDGLIDEKRPRLFKKVKNYADIYFQYYQAGKRPIDAAKI